MVGRGICPDDDNAMVQAHGHVPLKPHGRTFLREVPGRMRRHHCDERPPRPARRAGHCYGEHKRVREGISAGEAARRKALSKRLRKSTWRSSRGIGVLSRFVSVRVMMGRGLFEIN